MLKTIRTEKSWHTDPGLIQPEVSMAHSAAARHAHYRLHLLPSSRRNSVCMHMPGQHTAHTSCAVALVAPAEALAAWEIVSVAALVLALFNCGPAPTLCSNVLHICEAPREVLASL